MTDKLDQLQQQKEKYVTRIFWMALEIILIFGIPAAIGAWIGFRLGGGTKLFLILGATFIFSWIIVIVRFRQIHRQVKQLESEINAEQQRLDQQTPQDL